MIAIASPNPGALAGDRPRNLMPAPDFCVLIGSQHPGGETVGIRLSSFDDVLESRPGPTTPRM